MRQFIVGMKDVEIKSKMTGFSDLVYKETVYGLAFSSQCKFNDGCLLQEHIWIKYIFAHLDKTIEPIKRLENNLYYSSL